MEMSCEAIRRRLVAYLDGELDARAAQEVDRHLLACAPCRGEAESLRAMRLEWRGLPSPVSDPRDREAILLAAATIKPARWRAPVSWFPWFRASDWVTVGAAAMALLLAWAYRQGEAEGVGDRRSWLVWSIADYEAREDARPPESGGNLRIRW